MPQPQRGQRHEPNRADRPEQHRYTGRAARLDREQADQDADRHAQNRRFGHPAKAGDSLEPFHRRQHRQRRGDDRVAIEHRGAGSAQQQDDQPACAGRPLGQRHQRQHPAFAVVVHPAEEQDVLQRHHDDQRPQRQRQHAQDLGARNAVGGCLCQRFAERVQRTGADIAVDHADRAQCERGERVAGSSGGVVQGEVS